jgi:hypothetical protein
MLEKLVREELEHGEEETQCRADRRDSAADRSRSSQPQAHRAVSSLTLVGYTQAKATYLGIAVLIAAAAIMPWLAREKRRLSSATGSAALRADSAQSALCAYLSLITLVGLGVNAIWHVAWADPVAGLVVTPSLCGKDGKRFGASRS